MSDATFTFESTGKLPVVVALLPDLMAATRVEAAGRALGYDVRVVDSLSGLRSTLGSVSPAAVVMDLADSAFPLHKTLSSLPPIDGRMPSVLAFFPHVMADLGRAARAAGCTVVVPRSQFMQDLPALLRRAVEGSRADSARNGPERGS